LASLTVQELEAFCYMATTTIRSYREETLRKEAELLRKRGEKIAKSKKSARAFLIRAGILTKSGRLAKQYR